jgi:hypothetical protein
MTEEEKAEFLRDIDTMSTEEVRVKWNFKTKQTVYDRKYRLTHK